MDKFGKKIKLYSSIVYGMILIMIGLTCFSFFDIIDYAGRDNNSFEVKIEEDNEFKGNYCLYVGGKNIKEVDYNDFCKLDLNRDLNIKMCLIIEDFTRAIYSLMMISILLAVYRMIQNSDKKETSFMKRNMAHIKTITIVTISISAVPGLFKVIATSIIFGNVNVHLSQANLLILFFGIIFGIISQMYKYKDEAKVEKKGKNTM